MKERLNTFICRQLAKITIWVAQNDIDQHYRNGTRSIYHNQQVERILECEDYLERTAKN